MLQESGPGADHSASADVAFRGRQVLQFPRRNVTRTLPLLQVAARESDRSAAIIRLVNFLFMNSSRHVSKKILFISRESTNVSVFRVRDRLLGLPPPAGDRDTAWTKST